MRLVADFQHKNGASDHIMQIYNIYIYIYLFIYLHIVCIYIYMRKIIQYYFVWLSPFTRSSDFQQIHQDQRVLISDTFECDQNHLDGADEKYMRILMFTWSDDV